MLNNMKFLIGILIVVCGLAYWVMTENQSDKHREQAYLIPTWQADSASINLVDQIKISKGTTEIELVKSNDLWVLNDGFYADMAPIYNLVQALHQAQIVELKTSNPKNHAQVELGEGDLVVRLLKGDEPISGLHIGKTLPSGLTFVRRLGEDQSFTVKGLQPISIDASKWLLKTVIDVPSERVAAVQFKPTEGTPLEVAKNTENGQMELINVPAGQQLAEGANVSILSNGLTKLVVDQALEKDLSELQLQNTVVYQLMGELVVKIDVFTQGDNHYLVIESASYPQYSDWMFKIPAYKFTALNQNGTDFMTPVTVDNAPLDEPAGDVN